MVFFCNIVIIYKARTVLPPPHFNDNNPFIEHHHPNYTPIKKLEDKEIKKAGLKFLNPNEAAAFLNRPTAPPQLKTSSSKLFRK